MKYSQHILEVVFAFFSVVDGEELCKIHDVVSSGRCGWCVSRWLLCRVWQTLVDGAMVIVVYDSFLSVDEKWHSVGSFWVVGCWLLVVIFVSAWELGYALDDDTDVVVNVWPSVLPLSVAVVVSGEFVATDLLLVPVGDQFV